jgi:hydroxyethylthiazole kinase-like sugar kinase family protein
VRTHRRTPQFRRIIVTGALVGFVVGAFVSLAGDSATGYSGGSQLGFFGVLFAALGAFLAALVAVLIDRRP